MSEEQVTVIMTVLSETRNIKPDETARLIQAMDKASASHPETAMILKAICAGISLTSEVEI